MQNIRFLGLTLVILLWATQAEAQQESGTNTILNRASQYHLGNKDEILIKVNIWGYVQKPGQYLVPRQTDLISLMSFAGGPRPGAKINSIRIVRDESVVPYLNPELEVENGYLRDGQNGHSDKQVLIINVDVDKYIETGDKQLIPVLRPGDTVIVSASMVQKVKDTLGFISAFAIIAQMAFWITIIVD